MRNKIIGVICHLLNTVVFTHVECFGLAINIIMVKQLHPSVTSASIGQYLPKS